MVFRYWPMCMFEHVCSYVCVETFYHNIFKMKMDRTTKFYIKNQVSLQISCEAFVQIEQAEVFHGELVQSTKAQKWQIEKKIV